MYTYIWLCILYLWLLEFIYLATVWKCKKHVAELSCLTFRPTTFTPIRSLLARSRVGPWFPVSFLVFSRGSIYVTPRCPSRDAGCHRMYERTTGRDSDGDRL